MSFRAFVVGADYHLQFARADAERIADALATLGYELPEPRIPPPEECSDSIIARLKKFATDSRPDDTLLFYFAGHGIPREDLYLVLPLDDPDRNPIQTCLSMIEISNVFKRSAAATKIIILDCCHAGKAFNMTDFVFSDNCLVVTASDFFERAVEFKDRKAGFLSYNLRKAMTEYLSKITNNSRVTLGLLQSYLWGKVEQHNQRHTDKVPDISIVSKQKHEIVIAELAANQVARLSGIRLTSENIKKIAQKENLKKDKSSNIIITALKLLDREAAKPFAKKLLEERQGVDITCTALKLLDREEAKPFARKLLEAEGQAADVICTALNLLDKDEAKPFAKKLLEKEGQEHQIICTALNLLDREEAKPFARKLLEKDGQSFEVIYTALSISGEDAADYAAGVLDNWQQKPFNVVLRCLNIAPASRQAEDVISFLLKKKRNQYEYFRLLEFPFPAIPAWQEETRHIISKWKYTSRQTVAAVLRHYLDDPFLLNKSCFEILSQWKYDIEYQRKKFSKTICTDHILIALGHPHLRVPAQRSAAGMLLREKEQPGFLGDKLLQAAEAIVNEGMYPDWEKEAD
ncbi:caspase family protein [Candidatus Electronema sp. PJ]|uniref:caspase family protein n=1 Tax=Candidatus Electronema sp. PJ TaxID=3401572 RepID=UPI003AA7B20F